MLEVKGLTKRFRGLTAVDNVSFQIHPGQILGYLGPNGSGKSTTVKIITGLLDPSEGEVLLHGRTIVDDPIAFKSRLGYVPEEPQLYTHLTGAEYLILIARLRAIPFDTACRRAAVAAMYWFAVLPSALAALPFQFLALGPLKTAAAFPLLVGRCAT